MVLKDAQCTRCGAVRELMMERDDTTCRARCEGCGRVRKHVSLCTGGIKRRWRFADLGGIDHSEYVDYGVKAGIPHPEAVGTPDESRSAEPLRRHKDDAILHDQPRFGDDARKDRREKRKWKQRHREGRTPLHFNGANVGREG